MKKSKIFIKNKRKREYDLVASVINDRLEDNDSHHLHLIVDILNCQGWDRTMTKTGRTEHLDEMFGIEQPEQSEGEEEEDICGRKCDNIDRKVGSSAFEILG